ncbi:hypothetical protein ALC57_15694 [Trachymyrmex cornetzi]|uniref:Uncharacterized protein n=1 Tax=Trachymyrmex cornetzi TaxID=471704 RepID=A0A151IWH0_9HYME|nr:hypothetical protein ALC57_15694 [Trachymyrmex cornetzi]
MYHAQVKASHSPPPFEERFPPSPSLDQLPTPPPSPDRLLYPLLIQTDTTRRSAEQMRKRCKRNMPKGNRAGRDQALKRMQREYYWRVGFDPREFADPRIVQPPGFYHPVPGNCQDLPPPPPLPARPVPKVVEIEGAFRFSHDAHNASFILVAH